MTDSSQVKDSRSLAKDLIGQLSGAVSGASDRSLGIVGPGAWPPHPPARCLRTCLNDDPGQIQPRGCAWLRAAASGRLDAAGLHNARCPSGFPTAACPIRLNGNTAFLLAIDAPPEDHLPTELPPATDASGSKRAEREAQASARHEHVLGQLESLSGAFEKVGQLLDENEGLVDEVLRSYEQLNLIFDFTQQIVSFTNADEIEKVLLRRLGALLAAQTVLVVGAQNTYRCYDVSGGRLISDGDASVLTEQLTAELNALRKSRSISVHSSASAHIAIGPLVRLDDRVDMVLAMRPPDTDEFTSGDLLLIESLLTFGGQIISNAESHERLRRMSLESTRALVAAIDKKDHYTSGHSERVGYLARLIGRRMGVPVDQLRVLEMSGLLHDVGKIGIPEGILLKPGKLTKEEHEIIRNHPRMGYEILTPIASFGEVLAGVLHHHENPDGTGYPDGLAGEQIPLFARILHVADVFDALTSTRSYRVAFSPGQACEILCNEAGTKLDGEVVAVFLEMIPELRANPPEQLAAIFSPEGTDTGLGGPALRAKEVSDGAG
jgi:HD-GYP domain-containing protein (c-di-GMP phosphodiesterase class II)